MKNTITFLLTSCFILSLLSCAKDERTLTINLYASEALTQQNEQSAGVELISLLEPISCSDNNLVARPNLFVHRLDIKDASAHAVEFPLSKAGEFRRKTNFLSFKHYLQEFKENGAQTPNDKYLYQEGDQRVNNDNLEIESSNLWYCCAQNGPGYASMESLVMAIRDSLCRPDFKTSVLDIVYSPKSAIVNPIKLSGPVAQTPEQPDLTAAFNEVGNANVPPAERLKLLDQYLPMFTADADVKILGQASGKIVEEPIAIRDYLERISIFKSLEKIEVVEALTNDEGKIWEVRLKEYHN